VQWLRRGTSVSHQRPGSESPLHVSGWSKVEKVLQAIEAVEALGISADLTGARSPAVRSACPPSGRRLYAQPSVPGGAAGG
jgi:hypothetical protein